MRTYFQPRRAPHMTQVKSATSWTPVVMVFTSDGPTATLILAIISS